MSEVDFSILGPLTVRLSGAPTPVKLGDKLRLLLGRLLVEPGMTVARETLLNDVWGIEHELASPGDTVHHAIRQLRQKLGDTEHRLVVTVGTGYRLHVDPMAIDAQRFKRL